jgi:competence protein ComEC
MQPWMIGLVSGVVSSGYWPVLPPGWVILLFTVLAVLTLPWRPPGLRFICGMSCGCALALLYGTQLLKHRLVDQCVGIPVTVTGIVNSLPTERPLPRGELLQRFEFSVTGMVPAHCAGPRKLMLSYYGDDTIHPGDAWQFEAKLKKPWGLANPASFNMQVWFAQQGIDGVGNVSESIRTRKLPHDPGLLSLPDQMRQDIARRIDALQPDRDIAAILRAVTVADGSGIDPHLWFLFQQYGLNHLLVVSGLHVVMVAAVGYFFGGACLRLLAPIGFGGSWLPGVCALLLAFLYSALAGFSIPVQRALCMLACFAIASIAGRNSGSTNSLLVAAVVVLGLNPLAALGSGFWLSFGAVAALLWLARWQRGMGPVYRLLQAHGYMSLFMLPLGALFFGGGSLVAMLANLVMIPLLGWLVVPVALLAVVGYFGGLSVEPLLWQLAGWPMAALLPIAGTLAEAGGDWLYVPLTAGPGAVMLGIIAVSLLLLPGRNALKPLALLLAVPMLLPPAKADQGVTLDTQITVLDVGQGTAVIIQSGDRALLYDTGGGDPHGINTGVTAVLPFLRQQGVRALDTLIISHPDLDHSAGTTAVLEAVVVDRFRYGGANTAVPGTGRPCQAGEAWRWPGGQVFQFLSPAIEVPARSNDSSCVLQVQVGDYSMLLPGDIEEERERTLARYWAGQLRSDWLLAGHHGSRTSSSLTFLKWVQPEQVVISSGYANRFGHPHPAVMARFALQGSMAHSTAEAGALEFTFVPGQALRLKTHRQAVRRYWM